jgi:hypothetical protein
MKLLKLLMRKIGNMNTKKSNKLVCPVTKEECVLYDFSSGIYEWCDDNGDPSEYERCPIPEKAKKNKTR